MTDAVIVSTARTPIGKAYRGALNATEGATLLGHAIGEAVARAKVDPAEVEFVDDLPRTPVGKLSRHELRQQQKPSQSIPLASGGRS